MDFFRRKTLTTEDPASGHGQFRRHQGLGRRSRNRNCRQMGLRRFPSRPIGRQRSRARRGKPPERRRRSLSISVSGRGSGPERPLRELETAAVSEARQVERRRPYVPTFASRRSRLRNRSTKAGSTRSQSLSRRRRVRPARKPDRHCVAGPPRGRPAYRQRREARPETPLEKRRRET